MHRSDTSAPAILVSNQLAGMYLGAKLISLDVGRVHYEYEVSHN